jgi:hypothetical protein
MSVRYKSGEIVQPGDIIQYLTGIPDPRWLSGTVQALVRAGESLADALECSHDGVFFMIRGDRGPGLMLDAPETGVLDENYRFVCRSTDDSNSQDSSGCG